MVEYNTDQVHIIKTYQMYRRTSLAQLQQELDLFRSQQIHVGVKLVQALL